MIFTQDLSIWAKRFASYKEMTIDNVNLLRKIKVIEMGQPIYTYIYYSAHSPKGFSVVDYIKYLSYLLTLTIYIYSFPHYFPNY